MPSLSTFHQFAHPIEHFQKAIMRFTAKSCWLISFIIGMTSTITSGEAAAESLENSQAETGIFQYWYTADKLNNLNQKPKPDDENDQETASEAVNPKPIIPPQCSGIFFNPNTFADVPAIKNFDPQSQIIRADHATYQESGTSVFEGNVSIRQGQQLIASNKVEFNHSDQSLNLFGNITVSDGPLILTSEQATHNLATQEMALDNSQFVFINNNLNGKAEHIDLNKNITIISRSEISSCPPDKRHWLLKSQNLTLNQESGWGTARHARLEIKKIPIFYSPYFTFPIDDRRKSGFLYPAISSDSINGTDISVPYYFNIAPNYDATLTLRYMHRRGEMLSGEFRYLNAIGEGTLAGDILDKDKVSETYQERKYAKWTHFKQFNDHLQFNSDYQYLSDPDYFIDFGGQSSSSSLSYLERNATFDFIESNYFVNLLARDFQLMDDIDENKKPYRLLPQVNAGGSIPLNQYPVELGITTQFSQFDRDVDPLTQTAQQVTDGSLITGQRNVLIPSIELPYEQVWGFFKPQAQLHYRQYSLDDYDAIDSGVQMEKSVPIYTIDSGLIFERDLDIKQSFYIQTLEPRLFFVKVPYRDQSEFPIFDTSELTFKAAQLFRDRRFSGHDRVGDTEQLTTAVSSRIYSPQTNQEIALFTVGQIHYFRERQLSLNGTEANKEPSPVIVNAQFKLGSHWKFDSSLHWSSAENLIEQINNQMTYQHSKRQVINLEYRYSPVVSSTLRQEESKASFLWQLHPRWAALAYWNFDLDGHSTIEIASGLEYENCCLIVRILNQKWRHLLGSSEQISGNDFETANKQTLELQLKGLGRLNDHIIEYFKEKIGGYNER